MERLLLTINRDALIRLQFMPGVGLAGRRKVWQFLQAEAKVPLTLTNLLACLALPETKANQLINCWRDSRLSDTIARNQQFSKITTILDEDYPAYLKEIYTAPLVLFSRGNWQLTQQPGWLLLARAKRPHIPTLLLNSGYQLLSRQRSRLFLDWQQASMRLVTNWLFSIMVTLSESLVLG